MISHRRSLLVVLLAAFAAAPCSFAAPKQVTWNPNYTAALALSKKQNKLILAYFSGSDWDEWGKKLEKEVLSSELFVDWITKNVIPFRADYPALKKQDLYKRQNEDLKVKYQVAVVPTFLLLDQDGEVIARATYENLKLLPSEPVGQPKTAVDFLDNMVKNRGETEPLVTYASLLEAIDNAKNSKLPVLLLITKGDKGPMLVEAANLAKNQRFIRWVNVNTSFHQVKWPEASDKSAEAQLFNSLAAKYKFGNTEAQLVMFVPDQEDPRLKLTQWSVMQMEPLMTRLQRELPLIPYEGTTWLTDIRTAKAILAQQPKRLLFLYFTDNTEFCQKFETEILKTEEFTGWPYHNLVLVRLDYTKGAEQPKYIADQNKSLADLYAVRGFPFCILLNTRGAKVGEAKYMRGGPKPFIDELKRIYEGDEKHRLIRIEDIK